MSRAFCGLLSEGSRLCCAVVQGEEPAVHCQVCSVLNMHVYVHTDTQALYSIHVSLYVYWYCSYNVEDDQVNCFIRIAMENIEKLIIGEAKEAMISILLDSLRPFVFPSVHPSLRVSPRSPGLHHSQLEVSPPAAVLHPHGRETVLFHLQDSQLHLFRGRQM